MAGKTSDWRPGPTVCRCCLTEGCYKDISTEYFWMGKREVYAEMLSDTFNVSISYAQTGGRLICEPCIARLRDASDFKRQVQDCEKTFMIHLDPSTSKSGSVQIEVESVDDVKMERVKVEKDESDDDDFPGPDFGDDDDDDDLDDEPLQKYATAKVKVPKKEAVEILDMLDTSQITVKRKASSKTKEPPKKVKKKEVVVKPTTSKAKAAAAAAEKKKKVNKDPTRTNAEVLLRHTTAFPFRVNDKSIVCVYCHDFFEDPFAYRTHMRTEHDSINSKIAFFNLPKMEFIKADITDLQCRLCNQAMFDLEAAATHLTTIHGKNIDPSHKLGVMPYRLKRDEFVCTVCSKAVPSLLHLNRHTITHFLVHVCHVCGCSYVASTGLLRHMRTKHQQYEVRCMKCGKKFPTIEAKEKHRRQEKSCMPYTCMHCPERFADFKIRQKHLETVHGQQRRTYRCGDCNIEFPTDKSYYNHFKLTHSDNCAICKHCGMKFVSVSKLKRHLAKHNIG